MNIVIKHVHKYYNNITVRYYYTVTYKTIKHKLQSFNNTTYNKIHTIHIIKIKKGRL